MIVVLGDSISAEYGLPRDTGWVALMRRRLADERLDYSVANASISGDTTSGGRARLPTLLERLKPAIVIVELGANDALRGIDPKVTRSALTDILTRLKARGIAVLLCGMYAPPNYGSDYASRFNPIYPELAKSFGVPLYPFFLQGVVTDAKLNQADGMHPTAEGVDIVVDNILPTVQAFLGAISGQRS